MTAKTLNRLVFVQILIKCKCPNSVTSSIYNRPFSRPRYCFQKRFVGFVFWYYLSSQKMEITLLRYRTFSSKKFYAKMLYLRWSFNNSSSSVPSRVFAALEGKSFSCCCCTALNTIVYRTVSISDISLPRLKIKMKNGFQCLGELLSVFGIWSKLESSKHNISKIQK